MRRGRPASATLYPEHAELIRKAVKAAAKYYGVRIEDLGRPSKWIIDAMRTTRPLSVAAAVRLIDAIDHIDPSLIGAKVPQGPTLEEMWSASRQAQSDSAVKPSLNPTIEYFGSTFLAHLILERYTAPIPGSVIFVLPGASNAVAEHLADIASAHGLAKNKRRQVFEQFAAFLKDAETPLESDLGKKLIPRLTVLRTINNLNLMVAIQDATTHEDPFGIIERVQATITAEAARDNTRKVDKKAKPRKKRRVVLPSVRRLH